MIDAFRSPALRSCVPPPPPAPATRQGQREIVAATLAAAMIVVQGKPITAEEAVARWREVREKMESG